MVLEAACPRCPAEVTASRAAWTCPLHGPIAPLWRSTRSEYDGLVAHLHLARPLPTWLPWPVPPGWHLTDYGCVAVPGASASAVYTTCSGPSEPDGVVEVTVVTEEPGVGLGARIAQVTHTDPGREAVVGAPAARIRVDEAAVPLWPVPTVNELAGSTTEESVLDRSAPVGSVLDRSVLVGEAGGRWVWLVLRPAPAALLLHPKWLLHDVSSLGPALVDLPFGEAPRAW
jgi:hypothetical protein